MGQYETTHGKVSEQVVVEIAEARDIDPLELPPLYNVIDLEALNQLVDHGFSGSGTSPGYVLFTIAGCEVVVHSTGEVDVTVLEEESPGSSVATHSDDQNETKPALD